MTIILTNAKNNDLYLLSVIENDLGHRETH